MNPRSIRSVHGRRVWDSRGRPTVEATPQDPADRDSAAGILDRFGEPVPAADGVAVRLRNGVEELANIVRALDAEGVRLANLELHAPTLDDVFLNKTGRSLEGAGDEAAEEDTGEHARETVPA